MPSVARDESRDRELVLKHHPSVSDSGRASVPMYAPPSFPRDFVVREYGGGKGTMHQDLTFRGIHGADIIFWQT